MNKDYEYAIEVRHVYKDFKMYYDKATSLKEWLIFWNRRTNEKLHILKDINLNVKKGEALALIGTNGSGKSTLLKLITKIIYPNKGEIIVRGKVASLLELGAGFHPDFSGRENIYFNASIFGMTKSEIDDKVDEIIKFSELEEFIDNPVRTYSSGMYMRLAFSVAISVKADVLLIDEILAVGDEHFQQKCYKKMEELRNQGITIVFVSHSMPVVNKFCNRAAWIKDGEVRMIGKTKEVTDEYLKECK